MRNTLTTTLLAAAVISSPLATTEALAKVKEAKFHFVQGPYENLPAMEMKYSGGKWVWSNKSDVFKPRLKVYYKASKKSAARVTLKGYGTIWATPTNYYTKKYEELATLPMGKTTLTAYKNQAAAVCDVFGGSKKTVRDINIQSTLRVYENSGKASERKGSFPMKIVCQAKAEPTRNPKPAELSRLQLKQLKMYTIPARPKCGKPVKMVAEFHTTLPGKVDFVYYRGDGENQKASVVTTKGGNGFVKRWAKSYTFKETTLRKYKIVAVGHKNSTPWVNLHVRCDNTKGLAG